MFEIDQRMSIHFDNGIGMGETRVESGKVEVCVRNSVQVGSETNRRSISIIPNQGMSSLVAAFCSAFWYTPSVGVSSFASVYRSCLALLSHVRASAVTSGDIRASTIADVDEKLFKARHALSWYQLSPHLKVKVSDLCRVDPFLIHLHSLL